MDNLSNNGHKSNRNFGRKTARQTAYIILALVCLMASQGYSDACQNLEGFSQTSSDYYKTATCNVEPLNQVTHPSKESKSLVGGVDIQNLRGLVSPESVEITINIPAESKTYRPNPSSRTSRVRVIPIPRKRFNYMLANHRQSNPHLHITMCIYFSSERNTMKRLFPYLLALHSVLIDRLVLRVELSCPTLIESNGVFWLNDLLKYFQLREPKTEYKNAKKRIYQFHSKAGLRPRSRAVFDYESKTVTFYLHLNANLMLREELVKLGFLDEVVGLDGGANVISSSLRSQITNRELHRLLLSTIQMRVSDLVNGVNRGLFGEDNDTESCELKYYITTVEIYQDFLSPDAMKMVRQLSPLSRSSFLKVEETDYRSWPVRRAIDGNCISISCRPYIGQIHKFYAKTPDLLRVEAQFDKKRLWNEKIHRSNRLRSFSRESLEGFLKPLVDETNLQLSKIDYSLLGRSDSVIDHNFPHYAVANACQFQEDYEILYSHFLSRGAIATTGLSESQKRILTKLVDQNVFERVSRGLYRPVNRRDNSL